MGRGVWFERKVINTRGVWRWKKIEKTRGNGVEIF
jgi:hypothetical protein